MIPVFPEQAEIAIVRGDAQALAKSLWAVPGDALTKGHVWGRGILCIAENIAVMLEPVSRYERKWRLVFEKIRGRGRPKLNSADHDSEAEAKRLVLALHSEPVAALHSVASLLAPVKGAPLQLVFRAVRRGNPASGIEHCLLHALVKHDVDAELANGANLKRAINKAANAHGRSESAVRARLRRFPRRP
jgi:hypothetical protein